VEVVQALQQILLIAGGWLALSMLSWALFFPLLRSASRSDAVIDLEAAEARAEAEALAEGSVARLG
jgi:hypothetical protein